MASFVNTERLAKTRYVVSRQDFPPKNFHSNQGLFGLVTRTDGTIMYTAGLVIMPAAYISIICMDMHAYPICKQIRSARYPVQLLLALEYRDIGNR